MAKSDAEEWGKEVSRYGYETKLIKEMSEEDILKIREDFVELINRIRDFDTLTDKDNTGKIPKILYSWDQ